MSATEEPWVSYRDYLLRTASLTMEALARQIGWASMARDEAVQERILEDALDAVPKIAAYTNGNPDVVKPRLSEREGDHGR